MKIYITYRNENEKIIKRNAPPPSHSTTFSLSDPNHFHTYHFNKRKQHSLAMTFNVICFFPHFISSGCCSGSLFSFDFDTHWQANRTHIHILLSTIRHSFVTATMVEGKKCQIKLRVHIYQG